MSKERFRDGAGILPTYTFTINHSDEEDDDLRRAVTRTAPTTGTGWVRQQGERTPRVFKYSGTFFTQEQYDAMYGYFIACDNRTVFFRDYLDHEFEVLITGFSTRRERVVANPRSSSLLHIWRFKLEMEVIE